MLVLVLLGKFGENLAEGAVNFHVFVRFVFDGASFLPSQFGVEDRAEERVSVINGLNARNYFILAQGLD